MASELTIDYTLSYKVSIDIDKAKLGLPSIAADAEDDAQFEEFVRDWVMANLEDFEQQKLGGQSLPPFITHFSVTEDTA